MTFRSVLTLSLVVLMFAGCAAASTITLLGNNANPGWLGLSVDGVTYRSLDYTGQRYASQGQTWTANVLTFDQIKSSGYYGPSDPKLQLANYLDVYQMDAYLFNRLLTDNSPDQVAGIQAAVYYLSTGGTNWDFNTYVAEAHNALVNHNTPDMDGFWFVNSPLDSASFVQGFMYFNSNGETPIPEPTSFLLVGLGLVGLAVVRRR